MKLLVSCDQVFDILTRGPFPAGHDTDEAVEQHLRACHECRQLAEALQPAVSLLHESLSAADTGELPAYQGRLFDVPRENTRVRPRLERLLPEARPQPAHDAAAVRQATAARLCALAALAGAIIVLVWGFSGSFDREPGGREIASAAPRYQPTAEGLAQLASLKLPRACFPLDFDLSQRVAETDPAHAPSPAAPVTHVCCTRCHAESQADRPPLRDFATLRASCSACHEST